jgi:hypothetical protein
MRGTGDNNGAAVGGGGWAGGMSSLRSEGGSTPSPQSPRNLSRALPSKREDNQLTCTTTAAALSACNALPSESNSAFKRTTRLSTPRMRVRKFSTWMRATRASVCCTEPRNRQRERSIDTRTRPPPIRVPSHHRAVAPPTTHSKPALKHTGTLLDSIDAL